MNPSRVALALVCALAALVYLNSLGNGFALDDQSVIVDNPRVHGLRALPDAVTGPYWPTGPTSLAMYRPLTLASFAVDWELWRGHPFGFHLTNVLLHVGVTALVFLLIMALGAGTAAAAAGAGIFAVHPVHVEAVANVVGRGELLAALFFLAACLAYLRVRRPWPAAAGVGGLFLLALLAKEMAITLPAALLLLHLATADRPADAARAAARRWPTYLALGVAIAVYFGLRVAATGAVVGGGHAPWFWGEPAATRVWTAVAVIPHHVRLMLLPATLLPDYGPGVIEPVRTWADARVALGVAAVLTAALATAFAWRAARLVPVGLLWFAVTVLPVSNLLVSTGVLLAERTLYLPSVGLALLVAGLTRLIAERWPARVRPAAAALVVIVAIAGARTWAHNPTWRDTDSIFQHLLAAAPHNYRAQWVTALRLKEAGRDDEAFSHLAAAVRLVPGHYDLLMSYGTELMARGDAAAAADRFDVARRIVPETPAAQISYANSLLQAGRLDQARDAAAETVARFPRLPLAHHLHALALARSGLIADARVARMNALRLDRSRGRWIMWAHLAAIEAAAGDMEAAAMATDSARATTVDPDRILEPQRLRALLEAGDTAAIPFW